ncbi:signal transduction histidine kinase [Pleurocapsa sp. PCC 7327]|uniref:ATP-binding response regulator n=1 Tax=Pleurocapsa sp. PCC 7327 TaxID=118163 RepID=UPI00029FAD48|nr:response regulator [Pleurocapsa sp. PCC 7327]AFY79142.1 signal transduction histidine kinase [Pleurocapsa sp. PCC 7327]
MNPDTAPKGNILIVDDTPDNLRLLSSVLTDSGYKVRCAIDGAMALMGAQAAPPDLIMLDIKMPQIDGYEVCQQLKADDRTREIPIIFISALDEVLDKVKAFTSGGVDYIQKPFQIEEVLARLENQLAIRRLQIQLQTQNHQLQQTQSELLQALEQERSLKQRIEEMAAIEERNRIARDIHDSLGHALTALNIQLQAVATLLYSDVEQAASFLAQAQRLGTTAMHEVRKSVSALREDEETEQPLQDAIASLAEEFRQATGIVTTTHVRLIEPVPTFAAKTLYRAVQEALTNVFKYADATQVQIQLATTGDRVCLTFHDNGKGFNCNQQTSGFGLQGMQERVAALNGNFRLTSQPGAGCQIEIEIPLSEVLS